MHRFIIPLAVLAACDDGTTTGDTDTDTPTDSATCPGGVYDGPTLVNSFTVDCDPSSADIAAFLAGLSASSPQPVIFMQETGSEYVGGQWSEEHPLESVNHDVDCLSSEELGQTIEELDLANVDDHVPGSSSVFDCLQLDDSNWMTFAVYVEDIDDNAPDCLATGHDAAGLIAGNYDGERVGADPSFALSSCIPGL